MRAKTNFAERPQAYEIKDGDAGQKIICFRQNIEEVTTEEGVQYTADEYTLIVPVSQALNKRIEANFEMWLNKAISEDYDRAAAEVRAARDKLLAESDKEMVIDRMNLEAPTGASFSAWLDFLKGLASAISGSWAQYRQALCDIPEQSGFPYSVEFPESPSVVKK